MLRAKSVCVRRYLPWAMVWLRVLLCPVILWAAHGGAEGKWLGLIVVIALVDDVYDGVLARRWRCDTPAIRLADSCADTVFYLGAAGALWLRQPQVLRASWGLLALLLGLEAFRYAFDLLKFGKAASYHSYLAKAWGLVLAAALVGALSFGSVWLVGIAAGLGIIVNCESLAMSLLLPRWRNDVKTLSVALALRREMLAEQRGGGSESVPR